MNELQMKLCGNMIRQIDLFASGQIKLSTLVNNLLGTLDAGSFEGSTFYETWIDLWSPLEISCAQKEAESRFEYQRECAMALRQFVAGELDKAQAADGD